MKNKMMLAGAICSGFLVGSVNAAEVEFFAGAAAGYQTDTVEGKIAHDTEAAAWQGRVGVLIEQQHRITGTFSYMEDEFSQAGTDYKQEQYSWLISYDYLLPVHKNVNLFAGVTVGANDNKIAGRTDTHSVYGGHAGAQYKWSKHFSSDIGYRYIAQEYDRRDIKIDDSQQVYLTLDYKF
ncbi:outer membrane protein [Shewanella youngdeokensis]|uniref:Outer membrane beta-barrel protein n=1 Tax=Shewanella youngdeokensis TaxID=2999068 RepID=A0ABZ0JXX8_9GAMM|nr:outer membrane beta-barrel protein [Shewanella sp. DAU334]